MKKVVISLIFFLGISFLSISCNTGPIKPVTTSALPVIESIPIPQGVPDPSFNTQDNVSSVDYYVPETIYQSSSELFAFYEKELPRLGWQKCSSSECQLPTPTDTRIETYFYDSESSGPFLQVGVNTMVEIGLAVTIWLIR